MYYISIFPGKSPGPHCRCCVHVHDGLPRVCAPRVCVLHVFIPRASHVRACVCGVTAAGTVGAMGAMGMGGWPQAAHDNSLPGHSVTPLCIRG